MDYSIVYFSDIIEWEVADKGHDPLILPKIHLNQMTFMNVSFKLHGTARFENCRFENRVGIEFAKNHYELETDLILKSNYVNYADMHQISLLRCFVIDLAAEFRSNVRFLLIQETKIKDAHLTVMSNYDPMKGQKFITPSYLAIKVDNSEIDNSLHVMRLPEPNDISNLIIRSSTFMNGCELQTLKVQEIEIYDSTFESCTVTIKMTMKIVIDYCKLNTTDLYFNKDGNLIETDQRQYPKVWLCHLLMKNTVSTEPLVILKTMASIDIESCTFQNSRGNIILVGNQNEEFECTSEKALTLSVTDSRFISLTVKILNFTEIKVTGSSFLKANTGILGAFGNDRCVKIKDESKRNRNIHRFHNGITSVEISKTTFSSMDLNVSEVLVAKVKECNFTEAYLKAEGFKVKDDLRKPKAMILNIINSLFIDTSNVQHSDSSLDCSASKENSLINIKQVKLKVKGSQFMMNCIVPRGFIELQKIFESNMLDYSEIKLVDSVFDASQINPTVPLVTIPYGTKTTFKMANLTLVCAYNMGYDWIDVRKVLQCESYCEEGQYKVNSSDPTVALVEKETSEVEGFESPACPLCPVGASCTKNSIRSLPDYWGFRHANGEVTMMRCPKDYCCRGRDTCKNVSSCNSGRTGPLCSQCEDNTTESLFSPNCVSIHNCQTALVSTAYIFAALGYALFLTFFNDIKKKVKTLSKCFKCKKEVKSMSKNEESSGSEPYSSQISDETEKNNAFISSDSDSVFGSSKSGSDKELNEEKESDSGMKYLQILFYYVQDASLFKVHLPVIESSSESWLIHFLQFSPEVLLIYTNITEMCFVENTTAAMKVLFTSLFGPFVMFILLLIYLFSKVLNKCYKTDALLPRLCQAFILVVLLSYQKVMQGAFLLVRCVTLRYHKVLHIDANVICFTWWQTVCEIFLGTCVIPVFLVLAYGPYLVEKKKLSVAMFVLACILPLPVALCYVIYEILARTKPTTKAFDQNYHSNSSIDDGNSQGHDDGNDQGHDGGSDQGHDGGNDQGHDGGNDHGHNNRNGQGHDDGNDQGHDDGNDQGHNDGNDQGHDDGNDQGHNDGNDQGQDDGNDQGHDTGNDQGHDDGNDQGQDDGNDQGNDDGNDQGHDDGNDQGHDDGNDQGHDDGNDQGHDDGNDQGHDGGSDQGHDVGNDQGHDGGNDHSHNNTNGQGHDDGNDQGHDDGNDQGHNDGNDQGHDDGNDQGHNDGNDQGQDDGNDQGHDDGNDQGHDDGNDQGHDDGNDQGHDGGNDYGHDDTGNDQGQDDGNDQGHDDGNDQGHDDGNEQGHNGDDHSHAEENSNSKSDNNEHSESEKIITEHLLKHYKALKICGVPMTWLAFHKLYRMSLIWCHTYIMEPLPRLSAMSVLAILVTFITIFVKPYKETTANNIAVLSHAASICISVINIVKSTLIVGDYDPNELVRTMVKYFDLCEVILLTWIPVVAITFWLLYTIAKISKSKIKGKDHETV